MRKGLKKIILVIIFWLCTSFLFAQKFDIPALKKRVITSSNDSVVSHDYVVLSSLYKDQKDSCRYYAYRAVESATNASDNVKAYAYYGYGKSMINYEVYDSAVFFFNLVNQLVDENDFWLKACNFQGLSNAYNRLGQIDLAIFYLFESIHATETYRDIIQIAIIYMNAADFFEGLNELNTSLAYCKKTEYLNRSIKDSSLMGKIFEKYGSIALTMGKYDSSLYYFNKALKIRIGTKDMHAQAYLHLAIGGVYLAYLDMGICGEYFEKAEKELMQGLQMSLACHSTLYTATAYNRLAALFLYQRKVSKAKKYAQEGLRYSRESKILSEERVAYLYLYECFEMEGRSDSAFYYYKRYVTISDSIEGDEKRQNLIHSQLRYTYEKKAAIQKSEFEREQAVKDAIIARNQAYTERLLLIGLSILSVLIIGLLWIAYSNQQKKRKNQQKFSAQILQSQEEERIRISKDLHDGIGQNLLLLKNLDPDHAELVQSTIDDLRTVLKNLHPVQLEKIGFTATIKSMAETIEKSTGIFISGEFENIDNILPKEAEINLYRIIQECLNNIIKHSGAEDSRIDILQKDDLIQVTVQDNGKGFDWKKALNNNSFGLTSIIERVHILRGNINIQSTHGNTKISIEIPR